MLGFRFTCDLYFEFLCFLSNVLQARACATRPHMPARIQFHNPISYNLMSQFVWPISATYFSETNEAWKVDRTQFNPCLLPIAFSSQWFRPALKGWKARTNVWGCWEMQKEPSSAAWGCLYKRCYDMSNFRNNFHKSDCSIEKAYALNDLSRVSWTLAHFSPKSLNGYRSLPKPFMGNKNWTRTKDLIALKLYMFYSLFHQEHPHWNLKLFLVMAVCRQFVHGQVRLETMHEKCASKCIVVLECFSSRVSEGST